MMFSNFKNLLSRDKKVICIHHKDLDGVACAIVAKNVFDKIKFVDAKYTDIDDILLRINYDSCDAVLILDISPQDEKSLDLSDKIVLLDHHKTAKKYHCPEKNRIVDTKDSAASLVHKFFSIVHSDIDLSHLNELIELANDYDMWIHKNPKSKQLNLLYFKYWTDDFILRFQNGDCNFTEQELDYIQKEEKKIKKHLDNLELFELEGINGCLTFGEKYPNDVCDYALKVEGYDIIFSRNQKTNNTSVRLHKHPEIDIGGLLSELGIGGGHPEAAGFYEEDLSRFQRKVEWICDELHKRFPGIRK